MRGRERDREKGGLKEEGRGREKKRRERQR